MNLDLLLFPPGLNCVAIGSTHSEREKGQGLDTSEPMGEREKVRREAESGRVLQQAQFPQGLPAGLVGRSPA